MAHPVRVTDAEYLRRYEQLVRQYVARYAAAQHAMGPGEDHLRWGEWAWIEDDDDAVARWARYAGQHGTLKAMNPDGTWRPWKPRGVG